MADWRADGLEIDEIVNVIPEWAVAAGLLRPWVQVQDAWAWVRRMAMGSRGD